MNKNEIQMKEEEREEKTEEEKEIEKEGFKELQGVSIECTKNSSTSELCKYER
jgi:hypothetical protein